MAKVIILLNQDREASFGLNTQFAEGGKRNVPVSHLLIPVFEYDDTSGHTDLIICEWAFETFNIGFDPDMNARLPQEQRSLAERYVQAVQLTASFHTSMSVGDVVMVADRAYSCESTGFWPPNWSELNIAGKGNQ